MKFDFIADRITLITIDPIDSGADKIRVIPMRTKIYKNFRMQKSNQNFLLTGASHEFLKPINQV